MNKKKLPTIGLFLILLAASVIGVLRTVYVSADIDESYALTMAARIAGGDKMFVTMWEPHQTSAVLYAPFVWIYKSITGSLTGVLVFMRWIGVLIQLLVSICLYRCLRKELPVATSMLLAFAYFNFTPKHIQSPEFTSLCYWLLMLLILSMITCKRTGQRRYPVFSGLCMSGLVLCYPTMVAVFIVCLLCFLITGRKDKADVRAAAFFAGTCVLAGVLFLACLFAVGGASEVLGNIPNILADPSHEQNLLQVWKQHLAGLWDMLKLTLPLIILLQVGRPVLDRKNRHGAVVMTILVVVQIVWALLQFHTIEKVNYMILYPVLLQLFVTGWYAADAFTHEADAKAAYRTALVINLTGVICIMSASNLDAVYSMSFLMPSLLLGLPMIGEAMQGCGNGKNRTRIVYFALLAVFMIQLLCSRILLVRFTSTQKKNIFEGYYETQVGPLAGIRLGEFDYQQYEAKSRALAAHVSAEDVFLYVGCDMFLYSSLQGTKIGTGNTISTPAFSGQLMHYYEKYPDRIPTVVFVDREYVADFSVILSQEPFGQFMQEYFDTGAPVTEGPVTIYFRK